MTFLYLSLFRYLVNGTFWKEGLYHTHCNVSSNTINNIMRAAKPYTSFEPKLLTLASFVRINVRIILFSYPQILSLISYFENMLMFLLSFCHWMLPHVYKSSFISLIILYILYSVLSYIRLKVTTRWFIITMKSLSF